MNGFDRSKANSLDFTPLIGLTPKQKEILKAIHKDDHKFSVIKGSRQAGKSILLQHILIYFGCLKHNRVVAYLAPSNSQAKKAFDDIMSRLPPTMIKKYIASDNDRHIMLINDTKLTFKTASSEKMIRGNTFNYCVIDEMAFIDETQYNKVIKPCWASKKDARIVMASTPLGRNMFYLMYMAGMDKENRRYKSYDLLYSDNPYYDVAEVQAAQQELPEAIFRQEYLGQFVFGASNVFGNYAQHQLQNQFLNYTADHQYYFGIDVSGDGQDKTILYIVNQLGMCTYIHECLETNFLEQVKEVLPYINKYNARGYVETNGLGKGFFDLLESCIPSRVWKWQTTNESKQVLIKELIASMNEGLLILPNIYLCSKLDNQMATYIANRTKTGKITYSHSLGCHDDYVDALLIANHARVRLNNSNSISTMSYEDYNNSLDFEDLYMYDNNDLY